MSFRRRKINIPLVKGAVMGFFGVVLGTWGGFTGLGTQMPAAGLIEAMLGLRPERVAGASAFFGLLTSAAAVAGARFSGMQFHWMQAVLLAVSAAIGAMIGVRGSQMHAARIFRKAVLTLAMFGALAFMGPAFHASQLPSATEVGPFATPAGYVLVGFWAGLLSALFEVPAGVLIILAVARLCGAGSAPSIVYALAVAGLAGILPTLVHLLAGTVPGGAAGWMYVGGSVGAAVSGAVLARLPAGSVLPVIAFGLSGAYLCAWRLWRLGSEEGLGPSRAGRV
ncbi:MAG: TSUP family transporter [Chthonomonadales bacterium]